MNLEELSTIRSALPTSRHAEMLFDSVKAKLAGRARLESAGNGTALKLHCRDEADPQWIAPWPILRLTLGRRGSFVGGQGELNDAVPEASGREPAKLRNLKGGEIEVHIGRESFSIVYAQDGMLVETCRSTDAVIIEMASAIESGRGQPIEIIADAIVARAGLADAPGRVRVPDGSAANLAAAWVVGLRGLRRKLFAMPMPASQMWIAADGYAGTAVGTGSTGEEAMAACLREIERLRPCPPEPRPMPELTPEYLAELGYGPGELTLISTPASDEPKAQPTTTNTPIAMTRVDHRSIAGTFGRSVALLDDRGCTIGAVVREDVNGHTLIGQEVLEQIDLFQLDQRIDAAEAKWLSRQGPGRPWPKILPPLRSTTWQLRPGAGGELDAKGVSHHPEFDPGSLVGDQIARLVLRERTIIL